MPVSWGESTVHYVSDTHYPMGRKQVPSRFGEEDALPERIAEEQREAGRAQAEILPSRIVLAAMTVLVGLQQLAGLSIPFGGSAWKGSPTYPFQGDCFEDGKQHFDAAAALLQQAVPLRWTGAAADASTATTSTLEGLAQTMAKLDDKMHTVVKDHAEFVSTTQLVIGTQQDLLIAALWPVSVKEKYPATFPVAKSIAHAAVAVACGTSLGMLFACLDRSGNTQSAVDRLKIDGVGYGDVITAVAGAFGQDTVDKSEVTVDPGELEKMSDYPDQAAAEAGKGVQATESVDLHAKLYETHGPISGPSNNAISGKAHVREDAGRAIQQACLKLKTTFKAAAGAYSGTDSNAAKDVAKPG